MPITFRVDDVAKATTALPTVSLREHLGDVLAFGGDGERRVVAGPQIHPFLGAVHGAFAEHRPLVLSPDAIWLTILAGVTQHVRLNSERLRDRLVRHQGQKRLEVQIGVSLRQHPDAIREVVPLLRETLSNEIGQGTPRLLTCDFSTTSDEARMASEIMLLDAFSPYFSYGVACVCGIPEITLLGEPDDWKQIRERVDVIAELDLEWWTSSLAPILDEFVEASKGSPKVTFFRDIYQPRDAYGGDTTVGWAARFYPYIYNWGRYDAKNPLLEWPVGRRAKRAQDPPNQGIKPSSVPSALGACRISVDDLVLGTKYALLAQGGLGAIAVDDEGRLIPIACWSIVLDQGTTRAFIAALRERGDARYEAPEPAVQTAEPSFVPFSDDLELMQLQDAFGELRLFEPAKEWRLRRPSEQVLIALPEQRHGNGLAKRLIDLPDGSFLALASDRGALGWRDCIVRLYERDLESLANEPATDQVTGLTHARRGPTHDPHFRVTLPRTDIPIVGGSVQEVLERALACDGNLDNLSAAECLSSA